MDNRLITLRDKYAVDITFRNGEPILAARIDPSDFSDRQWDRLLSGDWEQVVVEGEMAGALTLEIEGPMCIHGGLLPASKKAGMLKVRAALMNMVDIIDAIKYEEDCG